MSIKTTDFIIIGAGVMGLNIALSLKKRFPESTITIIEKEPQPGLHASGRNSGVLHAGFYYTSDSMKARFCKEGNQRLTEYCLDRKLPINRSGKLVVTKDASELSGLNELLTRGKNNGVELFEINEKEAREIEPSVKTFQKAIFSPTTATVSPGHVMESLIHDVKEAGIDILVNTAFLSHEGKKVVTSKGSIDAGYVINAAGLYADKIAIDYGFSQDYRILPFKGLYLYASETNPGIKTNIYPVPDLKYPFLGVHFTLDVLGNTKIGPTAIPALWREQYEGMENFSIIEMMEILMRDSSLFLRNHFGFRKIAINELRKSSRNQMITLASTMLNGLNKSSFNKWGKPGIRAQLVNIRENKLEMDFKYEGDEQSFHVLNAVSPAFTCSMPFADYLVEQIVTRIR
jgi:(S)-2-hydroxyglutarate dehydrogenase